jgi:hypothetical protein
MATATKAANSHAVVTTGWTNPANAYATSGDNVYATAAPAKNATVNGDFGFATFAEFDASAVINSVTVTVEWKVSTTTVATLGVQLRNSTTALGSETTFSSTTEGQSTQVVTSGISAADILNGLIKARIRDSRGNSNTAHTGSLDFAALTVDYTAATIYTDSGAGSVTLAGTGSGQVTYADSGSGTLALSGSGTESYSGPTIYTDSGTGAIALSGSGTDALTVSSSGTGVLSIAGQGSGAAAFADAGTGSVVLSGSGSLSSEGNVCAKQMLMGAG